MKKYVLALAVAAALTVAPFAGLKDNGTVSVGDFALKVSKALGYDVRDNNSAARTLRAAGVELGLDLNAKVTERMASDILGSLGVRVTTSDPSRAISSGKLDSLVTSLAISSISGIGTQTLPPPPTQCREIVKKNGQLDVGKCKKCCKMAIMSPNSKDKDHRGGNLNKICDRFCKTGEFPSPSEPEF
jgi:hypothetical protein